MTKTELCNLALLKIGEKTISSIDDPNDKNARHAKLHYGQARDEALRAFFWSFAMTSVRLEPQVAADSYARTVAGINASLVGDYLAGAQVNGRTQWEYDTIALAKPLIYWDGSLWTIDYPANGGVFFTSSEDVASPELVEEWTAVGTGTGVVEITTLMDDETEGRDAAFAIPPDFLKLRELRGERGRIDEFEMRRANGKRCVLADADEIKMRYVQRIDDPDEYDPMFTAALVTLLASKLARAISGSDQLETTLLQRYESVDLPAARTADGHDSQSAENHPLEEFLAGNLTGARGSFWDDEY
jgi:hypothetical protein